MKSFKTQEYVRQANFKQQSSYFSETARTNGIFKGKSYDFCLPTKSAEENLFSGIRQDMLAYFQQAGIPWHQGSDGKPTTHLCSSQVACVNFLGIFMQQPEALATLLRPIFPTIKHMLPMIENRYVEFEWIGKNNYLGERTGKNGKRTRGANATSADAMVFFEQQNGQKQLVLIEWKYTETYSSTPKHISKSGTSRVSSYQHLYDIEDCPLNKTRLTDFRALFYEPFYQFMRQQFLAHEMQKAREFGAHKVSVLHIAPQKNQAFLNVTSPQLRSTGDNCTAVWKNLLRQPNDFLSVHTENLFHNPALQHNPQVRDGYRYIHERYSWLHQA